MSTPDLTWQLQANCLEVSLSPVDPFYPEAEHYEWGTIRVAAYATPHALYARLVCAGCRVQDECRAYVDRMEHGVPQVEHHGIWAGESPSERRSRRLAERMNGGPT